MKVGEGYLEIVGCVQFPDLANSTLNNVEGRVMACSGGKSWAGSGSVDSVGWAADMVDCTKVGK